MEIFIERATTAQCMNVSTSVIGVGKGSCRITSTDSSAFVEQCLHYYYSIDYTYHISNTYRNKYRKGEHRLPRVRRAVKIVTNGNFQIGITQQQNVYEINARILFQANFSRPVLLGY